MNWTRASIFPSHGRIVIVSNRFNDMFFSWVEDFEDGSRAWVHHAMESEKLDRFMWKDCDPPTSEDWKR